MCVFQLLDYVFIHIMDKLHNVISSNFVKDNVGQNKS